MNNPQNQQTQNISVRYDKSEVIYATQFLASPSGEELMLDFSSGLLADPQNPNGKSLPIHTRLAMPWSAVERLTKILNQVVDKRKQLIAQQQNTSQQSSEQTPAIPQASLPQMNTDSA